VTRELERSAPLGLSGPLALDQRGPTTLAGFDRETPLAAWQAVLDGRAVVRTGRLQGDAMTATFSGPAGESAVLDDLATAPRGPAAVAWHTVTALGRDGNGFVAQAPAGGAFAGAQQVPGAAGAASVRLVYEPGGLLALWSLRTATQSTVMAAELR
jgi:hypothetical protein